MTSIDKLCEAVRRALKDHQPNDGLVRKSQPCTCKRCRDLREALALVENERGEAQT